jgi:hypothetical protein
LRLRVGETRELHPRQELQADRLDEPFGLALGLGAVGLGDDVLDLLVVEVLLEPGLLSAPAVEARALVREQLLRTVASSCR